MKFRFVYVETVRDLEYSQPEPVTYILELCDTSVSVAQLDMKDESP